MINHQKVYICTVKKVLEGSFPLFFLLEFAMITADIVRKLVEEKLGEGPIFIVDINVNVGNKITIELDADAGIKVSIDDCVGVSRQVESNLDREQEDFSLEVSSAGIGQPLKLNRQYQKNVGREVSVLLADGVEKIGTLLSVEGALTLQLPANKKKKLPVREETFGWEEIKETKVRISFK